MVFLSDEELILIRATVNLFLVSRQARCLPIEGVIDFIKDFEQLKLLDPRVNMKIATYCLK